MADIVYNQPEISSTHGELYKNLWKAKEYNTLNRNVYNSWRMDMESEMAEKHRQKHAFSRMLDADKPWEFNDVGDRIPRLKSEAEYEYYNRL